MSTLCLILGAGASHDCIVSNDVRSKNPNFEPPLTKDIFSARFDRVLEKYPKVSALAKDLRRKLRQDRSLSLEQLLRLEQQKSNAARKKQIRQVPLYLRELFSRISAEYVDPAQTCYTTLIHQICDEGFDKVLVLNLNYDTLFESALKIVEDIEFKTIDDYFNLNSKWKVLKPHGSINWIRKIKHDGDIYGGRDANLELVDSLDELILEGPIKIDGLATNFLDNKCAYPAMVIPVDGKYEFCCPEYQIEEAKKLLKTCDSYLAIGFSFKDKDVVDLLFGTAKKYSHPDIVHVVSGADEDAAIKAAYQETVLKCLGLHRLNTQGFSSYVNDLSCEHFLKSVCVMPSKSFYSTSFPV